VGAKNFYFAYKFAQMRVFHPPNLRFCFYGQKFSSRKTFWQFSDSQKFVVGNRSLCSPCHCSFITTSCPSPSRSLVVVISLTSVSHLPAVLFLIFSWLGASGHTHQEVSLSWIVPYHMSEIIKFAGNNHVIKAAQTFVAINHSTKPRNNLHNTMHDTFNHCK